MPKGHWKCMGNITPQKVVSLTVNIFAVKKITTFSRPSVPTQIKKKLFLLQIETIIATKYYIFCFCFKFDIKAIWQRTLFDLFRPRKLKTRTKILSVLKAAENILTSTEVSWKVAALLKVS